MSTVLVPLEPHALPPVPLVRSSATVSRDIAGETIVVPICSGVGDMEAVYTFNHLGSALWRLLAESRRPEELVAWVLENFSVSSEEAASDVHSFLADLREIGLIAEAPLLARPQQSVPAIGPGSVR